MSGFRTMRLLLVLAGLMGAAGVVLAAMATHLNDAARLGPASSMLLFHSTVILGAVALSARGLLRPGIGVLAAAGFVVGGALFAGDLSMRQFAGHALFPMAAPSGGTLLILSWLVLALAAVLARPERIG
jgi:uncharacterized membrane protein YgdD (TMEM256/DUF423 family)